jgi:hypothetical protein
MSEDVVKDRSALTIEVSEDELAALQVLDRQGDACGTLVELVGRVVDGVTRPGAWERQWLEQAFGDAWQQRLEPDPHAHWRQRPLRLELDEWELDEDE